MTKVSATLGRHRVGGDLGGADLGEDVRHLRELPRAPARARAASRSPASGSCPECASACSAMSPSSSLGTNSVPRRVGQQRAQRDQRRRRSRPRAPAARAPSAASARRRACAQPTRRFSRSATVPPRKIATAAGTKVSDRTIAPSSAKTTVSAIGTEHLALDAGEREDRQVDDHDDAARRTSWPGAPRARASTTTSSRSRSVEQAAQRGAARCASRRTQFSTMMTAPSTMSPKSIAPRLIRLALIRLATMPVIVKSIDERDHQRRDERGPDVAEEQEQHDDDEQRALDQILAHRLDGGVDQVGAVVDGPGHHARRAGCGSPPRVVAATARDTVRLFSPISMKTVPSTTSRPFSVAAPVRSSLPSCTVATSRT